MRSNDTLIKDALLAPNEGRAIEFKESFDPASSREWCEVLKDVFAIANSGGGVIVFGLNSQGEPVGADLSAVRMLDPQNTQTKLKATRAFISTHSQSR
jgi:predicted HTH transcriptional regulator